MPSNHGKRGHTFRDHVRIALRNRLSEWELCEADFTERRRQCAPLLPQKEVNGLFEHVVGWQGTSVHRLKPRGFPVKKQLCRGSFYHQLWSKSSRILWSLKGPTDAQRSQSKTGNHGSYSKTLHLLHNLTPNWSQELPIVSNESLSGCWNRVSRLQWPLDGGNT